MDPTGTVANQQNEAKLDLSQLTRGLDSSTEFGIVAPNDLWMLLSWILAILKKYIFENKNAAKLTYMD